MACETDFQGKLFPGSAELLAIADVVREIRTIQPHCGSKATMVVRQTATGDIVTDGAQIEIGGNDKYVSYAANTGRRRCNMAAKK